MEWHDDRPGADARGTGRSGRTVRTGRSGRDELVAIMARLAAGDEAAVVTLYERFGGQIAGSVQRVARTRPGRIDRDELDGLVFEVCFEMMTVARSWSADGGALPWVWARQRVANVVDRVLGHVAEPLDEDQLADRPVVSMQIDTFCTRDAVGRCRSVSMVERVAAGSMLDALERVSPDMASARLLTEAIDEAAISPRDREVMFEYAYEKASGNRAPAATVAAAFGMEEATVRQVFRRARVRLRSLVASNERYAPLAELPLLA